ncbi:DUF1353 domain-containing protein [Massilia atriviolacea]|uniref:DUF1353 domain-containing protein n=1 Tax=Massilia atriviolacea TaxID=2495579 RepID=A0A430HEF5_9BURK|nr:DUF1353 domain-containing protein [Massilia atriviolacea]RSZ55890.1 DUF1353 domain-containing protein [Massilia atriviolacea]
MKLGHIFGLLSISLVCAVPEVANASDIYYGKFLDDLKGKWDTTARPRPVFELVNDFRFEDPNGLMWTAPAKIKVDGASIPQSLWGVVGGPFEGEYINASVIHDHYCRTKERTAHDTHRNFYYGMKAAGLPEWKATLMHWAVATFGPKWELRSKIIVKNICTTTNTAEGISRTICSAVPSLTNDLVSMPAVDLSDPATLAMAVAKTEAIARTLKTSDGKLLDVTETGIVMVQLKTVEKNAEQYRNLFVSQQHKTDPSKLGILSSTDFGTLADTKVWPSKTVPTISKVKLLNKTTKDTIPADSPFKMKSQDAQLIQDRIKIDALKFSTELN